MAIPERSENVRYWAFEVLVGAARGIQGTERAGMVADETEALGQSSVAEVAVKSLQTRMRGALQGFVDDSRLRGAMPLGR